MISDKEGIQERWREYFDQLNKEEKLEENETGQEGEIYTNEEMNIADAETPPTIEEMETIMEKIKNNRVLGEDEITIELIKNAGMRIKEQIHKLLVQIWNGEDMPAKWKIRIICPIHKKGDKTDCYNYHGVNLLNVTYKILTGIINERIMQITEQGIGEYQCEFRRSRSTMDQIFIVGQIIKKHYKHGSDLHLLL
jgi:hypothetical protein